MKNLLHTVTLLFILNSHAFSLSLSDSSFLKTSQPRRLQVQTDNINSSYYLNQLLQTHQVSNEAQLQQQRQDELKAFDNDFKLIEDKVDEYRDGLAKKLLELKNSLERPKPPVLGISNMMTHPYTTSFSTSDFAKAKTLNQVNNAPSFVSMKNDFKSSLDSVIHAHDALVSMADPALASAHYAQTLNAQSTQIYPKNQSQANLYNVQDSQNKINSGNARDTSVGIKRRRKLL